MKSFALLLATGVSALAFASAAHAADLVVEAPVAIQYAEPAHSWDGAYVGVFGGYGWGTLSVDPDNMDPEGWLLGVTAGANFTLDNGLVVGVVGDIAWADMTDDVNVFLAALSSRVDWTGSVRGRVGFDGGAFMPYLTAGVAFAHHNLDIVGIVNDSDDQTHVGWTVGAGVEVAVADNISLDLLYRYNDFGSVDYTLGVVTNSVSLTSHQVTAGVNFGF